MEKKKFSDFEQRVAKIILFGSGREKAMRADPWKLNDEGTEYIRYVTQPTGNNFVEAAFQRLKELGVEDCSPPREFNQPFTITVEATDFNQKMLKEVKNGGIYDVPDSLSDNHVLVREAKLVLNSLPKSAVHFGKKTMAEKDELVAIVIPQATRPLMDGLKQLLSTARIRSNDDFKIEWNQKAHILTLTFSMTAYEKFVKPMIGVSQARQ